LGNGLCTPVQCFGNGVPPEPCACPPGTLPEGEPPCTDEYVDSYNGGCSIPGDPGWMPIESQGGGCADLCGKSCTFTYQGQSYRDTDWYSVYGNGGPLSVTCSAQFPVQLILIYVPDCHNLQYETVVGGICESVTLSWSMASCAEAWVWVGPSVFNGIPEAFYLLEICGLSEGCKSVRGSRNASGGDEIRGPAGGYGPTAASRKGAGPVH